MQAFRRAFVLAVLATALTACEYVNDALPLVRDLPLVRNLPFVGGACVANSAEKLKGIEWEKARIIEIRIRQGHFDPMLVRLRQNDPYVFRFINRDDNEHIFRAPEFFNSIAVERVTSSGKDIQAPCMIGVGLPPGQIVEVQFVADRDGRYEFKDSKVPFPTVFSAGTGGVVYISVPRTLIQSPFNLQVVEPPALVAPSRPTAEKAPAPTGFPVDPSLQAPGPGGLPGDGPPELPGDGPLTLPGDSPTQLPGDAPVRLPGDSPTQLPGDAPVRLPGDKAVSLPGENTPVALPGDTLTNLPGDSTTSLPGDAPASLPAEKTTEKAPISPVTGLSGEGTADPQAGFPGLAPHEMPGAIMPDPIGETPTGQPSDIPTGVRPAPAPAALPSDPSIY